MHDDDLMLLSQRSGFPAVDVDAACLRLVDLSALPRSLAERRGVLSLHVSDLRVHVAMASPDDRTALDEVEFASGLDVTVYAANARDLRRVLAEAWVAKERGEAFWFGRRCPEELRAWALSGADRRGRLPFRVVTALAGAVPEGTVDLPEHWEREPSDVELAPVRVSDDLPEPRAHVLVVDDDPTIRKLLVRTLQHRGYRVLEAATGIEAMKVLRAHLVDLLVIDAMLPGVNGFDVVRRLRESERYRHVRVIMVSAVFRGEAYARDAEGRLGVSAYIEKPFRVADVAIAAATALAKGGEERPAAGAARLREESEAHLARGIAAWKAGALDEAAKAFRAGLRVDPLAFRLRSSLGLLYLEQGQAQDAISQLERALAQRDGDGVTLEGLARAYLRGGYVQKARETAERAFSATADARQKEWTSRMLESLRPQRDSFADLLSAAEE